MDGTSTTSANSNSSAPGANGSSTSSFLNLGSSPGGLGLFQTSGGDSLANAFGSSLNGFSNDATANSSSGGGGANNPSFDLNDFPSLGGGVSGSVASGGVVATGGGGGGGDNGLAAALRQQQQLLQQQMMQGGGVGGIGVGSGDAAKQSSNLYRLAMSSNIGNGAGSNFNMATEDFPALPGAAPGEGGGGLGGLASEGGGGGQQGVVSRDALSGTGGLLDSGSQLDYTGLIGGVSGVTGGVVSSGTNSGSTLSQTRSTSIASQSGSGGTSNTGHAGSAIGGDYGLLGLLSVIRMTDADRNRLALGSDLTLLGLNLNSSDNLYSTFGGPFSDKPATREPHYQLPMCYYMQPPALKTGHLSKFQLETLFYIFYALPKDVLQAYAAQELYAREWRYHVESKVWFKQATASDGVPNSNTQAGQYIYFDINTWERRMYGNVNQNIAGGFLPEEDVRVKFPSS
ncbi:hypothetical protein ACHAWO_006531 [Cyclotella atomus]|uniref:NOT2/NOT3/NOT5 C-terminal domain-containing protein n=1 Tax=Cyclotella atomus TaxID=382360 RepID=A0ABD3MZB0_9STRA